MLTAVIFLIVLAILIFVHELGHFIVARMAGIRVDAFKIGFGPKILYWKRGETEYGINLIPFGGFVKIHGENPDEEAVSGADSLRSFVNKARWKQVAVLVAGVAFNFLFAWLLYTGCFIYGVTASNDSFDKYSDSISNQRIMITLVAAGSPAEKSKLAVGDIITEVKQQELADNSKNLVNDSNGAKEKTLTVEEIQQFIRNSDGKPLIFSVVEKNVARDVTVVASKDVVSDATSSYAVGIAMQEVGDLHLSFFYAVKEGFSYTILMIKDTAVGLFTFVANIFRGTANFSDVAGPVGIAGIVGNAAELGFTYLLMIVALISINLGVINLIPFPALDGGRTLFVLIEGVIRRRIAMAFTNTVNTIGFFLLMLLMVVVTYRDILNLFK